MYVAYAWVARVSPFVLALLVLRFRGLARSLVLVWLGLVHGSVATSSQSVVRTTTMDQRTASAWLVLTGIRA